MEQKKYPTLIPKEQIAPEEEVTVNPEELKDADPKVLAEAVATYLDNKKGINITVLDVAEKTSLTSYFVICSATSTTHAKALGDTVDFEATRRGFAPIQTEGRAGGAWVLLDFGPVIVHVFTREARDFYRIERLYEGSEG